MFLCGDAVPKNCEVDNKEERFEPCADVPTKPLTTEDFSTAHDVLKFKNGAKRTTLEISDMDLFAKHQAPSVEHVVMITKMRIAHLRTFLRVAQIREELTPQNDGSRQPRSPFQTSININGAPNDSANRSRVNTFGKMRARRHGKRFAVDGGRVLLKSSPWWASLRDAFYYRSSDEAMTTCVEDSVQRWQNESRPLTGPQLSRTFRH